MPQSTSAPVRGTAGLSAAGVDVIRRAVRASGPFPACVERRGWLGFTTPSGLGMILFGYGVTAFGNLADSAWLHGLKIVAVAVDAQAVWGMTKDLCADRERATIAVGSAMFASAIFSAPGRIRAIAGYGAAQAVPGPLFIFVAYLGTVMAPIPNGRLGSRLVAISGAVAATITAGIPMFNG